MGTLRPALEELSYNPPTPDQLERRQLIRDKIEMLSIRPVQDHGPLNGYETKRVRAGGWSGFLFMAMAVVLFVATLYRFGIFGG